MGGIDDRDNRNQNSPGSPGPGAPGIPYGAVGDAPAPGPEAGRLGNANRQQRRKSNG